MKYEYDKAKATALLKEAGCYPCKITLAISTSGSGQMQPLPMNELVKSQLDEAGFVVDFKVMDWNSLIEVGRSGIAKYPEIAGYNGSRALLDPVSAIIKPVREGLLVAGRLATGGISIRPSPRSWCRTSSTSSTPPSGWRLLTKLHEFESDQAVMIYVVHDLNPRALSPKLHGFVQAQSWFQDLTPITVSP